jgi:hypothetical protein
MVIVFTVRGNATFTAYAGINSNLFQACISVSLEQYGEASVSGDVNRGMDPTHPDECTPTLCTSPFMTPYDMMFMN